ncbi:15-hydroxyprostaglandin dehydrogenase [NAD(+)]-like [Cataglyphis hispanica]|uniref:15-hydroxyprostaglandin dehydrogenase [NAD(+)]-like n=1 Tax=Cataglyphis hispanica TaxID=1086592 RepID=UPI00217F88AD|nr:15-hydroxyprostaglandin dehydrogenase [NAD(+)]-like [Cataglyphis hispanica]XP_050448612.1 15-hydroxyprostaglandin dehydrogenase [NAD(+)]-like [Cataglyphis hispanica]
MDNIRNKTVMISGGSNGLGYKYAEILLRNGAKSVAIIDLPTSNGENAACTLENEFGENRAVFVACDVTKAEDLKEAFNRVIDTFHTLDILINNAGILNDKEKWEQTIDINVTALIRSTYLALDHMGKHKGGKGGLIVNISSVCGLLAYPLAPVYTASKHAVLGFSQSLAGLYDKTGVRVLIMCPGITKTKLVEDLFNKSVHFVDAQYVRQFPSIFGTMYQSADNVALAMIDLIQKGKNGDAWVSEHDKPPYAVDFPRYSSRSLPV